MTSISSLTGLVTERATVALLLRALLLRALLLRIASRCRISRQVLIDSVTNRQDTSYPHPPGARGASESQNAPLAWEGRTRG